jgi:hypothetical protein
MPFRCVFDGPHGIPDVHMAAPILHERYYMAPNPVEGSAMPWIAVGFEPGLKPEEPWPGQVTYELDRERSELEYRGEQPIGGIAVFRPVLVRFRHA